MENLRKKVVIVGGGITGLSAAFYTKKIFEEQQIPVDITIVEKSDRLGGKIQTLHHDGFIIEKGPDSFLARKQPIIELTKELGLEDELVGTNPKAKSTFILNKGKLHPMPPGLVFGIPTKVFPFIKTGLISPLGKIRAAMDLVLPKRKEGGDESLGHFIERRLGKEVLENITEPLLSGIYSGDARFLSIDSTFPQFKLMEEKHRSLIKGIVTSRHSPQPITGLPEAAKKSMFLSYKNGLSTLIDRLVEALHPIEILKGQEIEKLTKCEKGYKLILENGTELQADGLVLAMPTSKAARLLPELPNVKWLEEIPYVSVANIVLAFKKEDVAFPLNGSGFLVPRKEGRTMTACTWLSSKWLHTTPSGNVLFRVFVGRAGSQEWLKLSDQELLSAVSKDLHDMMGITAKPYFTEITRCFDSMPQYPVGHKEQLKIIRNQLEINRPGIYLCGAGYDGVGIPDCIQHGKKAAMETFEYLTAL
ncbi:protoporphyrinogen oxidase [Bacillus sp. FJAT-49711]|uniref:protoporphyrinogen oxidase n=1 Tax=Bacillus sp. FJAT-49711 TaxID=2833585 RepID=UPI001BC9785E|nr:protoporphyrinogen oxidase [Bacillus sp. FJAT-49711]MBS4219528.1 protoporphyrinogen oxidase [Bacillus sp. FJAT-49711]